MRVARHLAIGLLAVFMTVRAGAEQNDYERILRELADLPVDTASARLVSGVFIQHGPIAISLDSGLVVEMAPLHGKRLGLFFIGKGTASFHPTNKTERTNLKRFYPQEMFFEEFEVMSIACGDDRITSQLDAFERTELLENVPSQATSAWNRLVLAGDGKLIDSRLANSLLNNYNVPMLLASIRRSDELDVYMHYDPFEAEPYGMFFTRVERFVDAYVDVVQCPDPDVPVTLSDDGVESVDLVRISGHELQVGLDASLDFSATDRVSMEILADSVSWLQLSLHPMLTVSKVSLVDEMAGTRELTFYRPKDFQTLWVHFPDIMRKGQKFVMELVYEGDIVVRAGDKYTILLSSIEWYPNHSYRQKATFDISFEYPSDFTLASIGHRQVHDENGRRHFDRWVIDRPIRNASFHVGLFDRLQLDPVEGVPSSSILYITANQLDPVSIDVKQALEFFTRLYGPLPIDSLVATELPGSHGEAFPGLLHLSSQAFYLGASGYTDFFQEQFIAHEVAHQWWGIMVFYNSYRDRWISEGFAEYSALMYSQLAAEDKDKFFDLLKRYRDDIMGYGKKGIGKNLPPPPIDLGHRVRAGDFEGTAYNYFVYEKGAWVLHMLRNMMLDLNTMKEDAFMATMKTFFDRYKGKPASTADFQHVIEELTGVNMQWFFDQWVYGNQVPTYEYAYQSTKQADGTFKNQLRVRQLNVDPSFTMLIPVRVDYDDGSKARYRINMTGEEIVIDLPSSASEIDEVEFNEFMSVLCEVDETSF